MAITENMTGKRPSYMEKIEILAPAGSYEAFKAALAAGADAVYLGADRFGARAYADNLTEETLLHAIDEAHILDRKLYLTVNTLFKEYELDELYSFLKPYYMQGLDAVIVQDIGALKLVRESFPDLPVHISTQMTVTGYEGAAFLEKTGAVRVVPARELSYREIKLIRDKTHLEIECFVHGALCYSYSGACLMSSFIGGRSGNRGRCAQPCRLPYKVFDGREPVSDDAASYALNTKDISLIDDLPELIAAGVTSFKIEGRMKRPEYTAGVVSVYRKYLDLYLENKAGERYETDPKDKELLYNLFNRDGFSKSYYACHNGPHMMALNNRKLTDPRLQKAEEAYNYVRKNILTFNPLRMTEGRFEIKESGMVSLHLKSGEKSGIAYSCAQPAKMRPLDKDTALKQLTRTGGTQFAFSDIITKIADEMFMTHGRLNALRRDALHVLEENILYDFRRSEPELKTNQKINPEYRISKPHISVSISDFTQLKALWDIPETDRFYVPLAVFDKYETDFQSDEIKRRVWISLPHITRADSLHMIENGRGEKYKERLLELSSLGYSFLVKNMEDAAFLLRNGFASSIRLDHSMYTLNNKAVGFWREQGVTAFTVPLELNRTEILNRDNYGSELVIYGYMPLMISAQCLRKNYKSCTKESGRWILKDRKNKEFMVVFDCKNCHNIIYNSVPISLLPVLDNDILSSFESFRLELTAETQRESKLIVRDAIDSIKYGKDASKENFLYTRGHFNRGIE